MSFGWAENLFGCLYFISTELAKMGSEVEELFKSIDEMLQEDKQNERELEVGFILIQVLISLQIMIFFLFLLWMKAHAHTYYSFPCFSD